MSGVHIIWFRDDLRVHDHGALKAAHLAAERDDGQILPLYIFTKDQALTPDLDEALRELEQALAQRGARLHLRQGDPLTILIDLHARHRVHSLHVHETLEDVYSDRAVEAWSLRAGVAFRVHAQFGPGLALGTSAEGRDGWAQFMAAPRHAAPEQLDSIDVGIGRRPDPEPGSESSSGGRKAAIEQLRALLGQVSDLTQIGSTEHLRGASAFQTLKPFIALGVLSVREIWQAAISARQQYLKAGQDIRAAWIGALIDHLPDLEQERLRCGGHIAAGPSQVTKPKTSQLSLDLEQRDLF